MRWDLAPSGLLQLAFFRSLLVLAKQIARYGGTVVVLIHPNILGHKFEFEKQFYEAVKDWAWFGSMREFGDWWSARNLLHVDVAGKADRMMVSINAPRRISGVTIEVPIGWTLLPQRGARQDGHAIILDVDEGRRMLHFAVDGTHVAKVAETATSTSVRQ